jgi:hypothetical protein
MSTIQRSSKFRQDDILFKPTLNKFGAKYRLPTTTRVAYLHAGGPTPK